MKYDETFLQEMGLSAMPEARKQEFLKYIQDELEIRIGERIAAGLSEAQLQEYDTLTDTDDVIKWLEKNRPDFREIVNRTIEEMKTAIARNREQLLS